jgi:Cu(I)/Ag(I) efflux system membrane fusion protein
MRRPRLPRRGIMTKRVLFGVVLLALGAVAGASLQRAVSVRDTVQARTEPKPAYQCAMHPQIVSEHPGTCPICRMELRRVDERAVPSAPTSGERRIKFYRHPMRPEIVSDKPATDEMGMAYTPVYGDEDAAGESDVPGHAAFTLSPQRQQLIGVTRDRVATRALAVDVRAVGRVAYDPALYRAIVEYREAVRSAGALGPNAREEARVGGGALIRGAYLRLRQQGLSDDQVRALTRGDRDPVELLLPSDSVWVYAQVYEYEAPLIAPGQVMSVTVPSQPGREFVATVAAVDSILDPTTRTVRVRGLVATPRKELRPESFVQVKIHVPLGLQLSVPTEAVLDTGEHQIVFVVEGDGRFEPRAVTVGRTAEGYLEVLGGLREGEEVVTSANFLIDSESRFRAALAAFKKPGSEN